VRIILLAALALAIAAPAPPSKAEAPVSADAPFLSLTSHDLKSAAGLTYRIVVAPPIGPAPAGGYPVIYVMDGNAWAPLVSEIIRFNGENGVRSHVQPAVVVGIGYPIDAPFDMERRFDDLTTPTQMAVPMGGKSGGYDAMADFVEQVVKPDIEKRFPIDRSRQTLVGHSLGGLFTLRTLLNRPSSFQTYLALSPSVWWNNAALLQDVKTFAPGAAVTRDVRVYVGVGELEQPATPQARAEFATYVRSYVASKPALLNGRTVDALVADILAHGEKTRMVGNARDMAAALRGKGIEVRFDAFPEEDHFSVMPSEMGRAIPFALRK
jgi:predicted alpha/beta superfamily hydrolase